MKKLLVITMLFSLNAIAKTPPFNTIKYQLEAPSAELRHKVSDAWNLMYPSDGSEPNYKKAYELNQEAFKQGHPEGASNIGLIYEYGLGVDKDNIKASEWYSKAISKEYHSAQAELGLAKIVLDRAVTAEDFDLVQSLIDAARNTANNPKSLWYNQRDQFFHEAEIVRRDLDKRR